MPRLRVAIVATIAITVVVSIGHLLASGLGLSLSLAGVLNLLLVAALVAWYAVDTAVPRTGELYELFGVAEPVLRPALRLARRLVLLSATGAALVAAVVELSEEGATRTAGLPGAAVSPLAILMGALLAAIGWMYTTYEHERNHRAASTLDAIREQMYGDRITRIRAALERTVQSIRGELGLGLDEPIPLQRMETPVDLKVVTDHVTPDGCNLADLADDLLDALDQVAYGVRDGQLDYRTIEMVLRGRYVRYAFTFAPYIALQTGAACPWPGPSRPRARTRTWEHFLWLTGRLPEFDNDHVRIAEMVRAPLLLDARR